MATCYSKKDEQLRKIVSDPDEWPMAWESTVEFADREHRVGSHETYRANCREWITKVSQQRADGHHGQHQCIYDNRDQ